jgi:sodium/proline symporter
MSFEALTAFTLYIIFLMWHGVYYYKRNKNIEDYLLGGRKLGKVVTALSAQASDMSGWLLMGLPGAVYLSGLSSGWIAVGLFIGTFLNWKFVAARLRVFTEITDSITISTFFERRFNDPTGILRFATALITLLFFTIYTSSGLVAVGKLFEAIFGISFLLSVISGASVIMVYTFLGGFLAVCWTDLIQGSLMFVAILIVPIIAYFSAGGTGSITSAMELKSISLGVLPDDTFPVLAIFSLMAWGLGYFGQPHILARFMGINSVKDMGKSMQIAIVWVLISLTGAVAVGLIAIPIFPDISEGDNEKVFIYMIQKLFNPWIAGILLASILSAIMSTIDSQLLVSSSAVTEDLYRKFLKKNPSEKELVWIGRISVVIISLIATVLAFNPENTVLGLVAYAWGGLGAAFGPLILFALYSKKTVWQSALAGIVSGTIVLIVWKHCGLDKYMYEIVPGFLTNMTVIFIVNFFIKPDAETEKIFSDSMQVYTESLK